MDVEFINAFIAKQKALIDDFQSKVLILEVKHSLLEQQYNAVKEELDKEKSKSKKSSKGENE